VKQGIEKSSMNVPFREALGRIHHGDCITGLQSLPEGCVDLAFADPPFNIGYEYDEYDDRLEDEKYLDWSSQWIAQVYRVLKPTGAFWLAIGDEYAAQLKLLAERLGFRTRSWVIWYYTFGVHCVNKFTRSHAHLFYFLKNDKHFTFNSSEIAVPSARQLVYNDRRANPAGRMPDDTWILRPQDCRDGFNADEDTWYFPRVSGTFKERAGFHGCQMPEQLLGRIIRACSNRDDVVIDPFSGSATTLVVAKKLGRQFLGFELSSDYYRRGSERLQGIRCGDLLEGSQEPKISAPSTADRAAKSEMSKKTNKRSKKTTPDQFTFGFSGEVDSRSQEATSPDVTNAPLTGTLSSPLAIAPEAELILRAFADSHQGHSVERVVADPEWNDQFQQACDSLQVAGSAGERNRFLFRLRKSGRLKSSGIHVTQRTDLPWTKLANFSLASEIAWRIASDAFVDMELDDILCEPRSTQVFDQVASQLIPGISPFELRWTAIKLRKEIKKGIHRAGEKSAKQLGLQKFSKKHAQQLGSVDLEDYAKQPALFALKDPRREPIFVAETNDLQCSLTSLLHPAARPAWQSLVGNLESLELQVQKFDSVTDWPFARRALALTWSPTRLNILQT
jgi:site-specific DNA-methyltransferase (adenine-specific)